MSKRKRKKLSAEEVRLYRLIIRSLKGMVELNKAKFKFTEKSETLESNDTVGTAE